MKTNRTIITGIFALLLFSFIAQAQNEPEKNRFSLVFGLNQPLVLRGFNVEGNYWMKNWVIDYSHGFNLHADGKAIADEYDRQKVNFKITHSLGLGIGYRFTKSFNLRLEPKLHIYETYYEGQDQSSATSLVNFHTVTLGLGAYYRWMPFEKKEGFAKGITIVPSIRYWYKVDSSLPNDQHAYFNTLTNQNEILKAPNIGAANTPWIINVSVGYTF
ncbi:MAG: hypothetical protein HYZ44_04145 [Bacteroidetes bacterium]|nr:hypothetical protein [Bacteroidota bacterium]